MTKIMVAIPCYNCEEQIVRVLNSFTNQLLAQIEKVIVLDNQSTDNTIKNAQNTITNLGFSKINVYRNNQNNSLGGSHKVAFNIAKDENMDYVAILHGDDQAKTSELQKLIDEINNDTELGAVLGSRFMSASNLQGYSKIRIYGNLFFNLLFTILTLRLTKDIGSGLNIFRVRDLRKDSYLYFPNSLTFNVNLLLYIYDKKIKFKYIPITWSETDQVSNAKNFIIGKHILKTLLRWRAGLSIGLKNGVSVDYSTTLQTQ